jgi:hypothetical protein
VPSVLVRSRRRQRQGHRRSAPVSRLLTAARVRRASRFAIRPLVVARKGSRSREPHLARPGVKRERRSARPSRSAAETAACLPTVAPNVLAAAPGQLAGRCSPSGQPANAAPRCSVRVNPLVTRADAELQNGRGAASRAARSLSGCRFGRGAQALRRRSDGPIGPARRHPDRASRVSRLAKGRAAVGDSERPATSALQASAETLSE